MPEGDTLHRIARALQVLVRQRVQRMSLPRQGLGASVAGDDVDAVSAHGKNLLVWFSGGLVLHTHLKMTGVWHAYAQNERWRRPARLAVAIVDVGAVVAVCFQAPLVRLIEARRAEREVVYPLSRIDLIAAACDLDEVLRRLRTLPPETPIGVALLEQEHIAGVGNVYKSEGLFRARLAPVLPLGAVADGPLRLLLADLQQLLRDNVLMGTAAADGLRADGLTGTAAAHDPSHDPSDDDDHEADDAAPVDAVVGVASRAVDHYRYGRTTVGKVGLPDQHGAGLRGPGLAVYGRRGQPCLVCGCAIAMVRQGPQQRSSYFCPRCQPGLTGG